MNSPESEEHNKLGQELLIGASVLIADVILRSGLPDGIKYKAISLSRLHTQDEEICLDISPTEDCGYIISFSENHRVQEDEKEIFELGVFIALRLHENGSDVAFNYEGQKQTMTLTETVTYLLMRLPDFDGAGASVEIIVPENP